MSIITLGVCRNDLHNRCDQREHDRTIPEILTSLPFRAGMLGQSLTDVVSLTYVGQRAAERFRISPSKM